MDVETNEGRSDWIATVAAIKAPKYLAIVRAVETALDDGRLRPGDQLPPQRDLARKLSLNIGTVGRAYSIMQDNGLLSGEVGRGTFINQPEKADGPRSLWDGSRPRAFIDLSHSFPERAPIHPAIVEIAREMPPKADAGRLLARQTDSGLPEHRAAGARWLSRFGLDCSGEDVMFTCGGQHGLTLSLIALSRPGDVVMAEELAFYGLRSAAGMMGRSLIGIRMDREGIMPDHLDVTCRRTGAKVLFCTPTLHNPTTAIMSEARRQDIIQVCRKHDVMIVEDDVWNFMLDKPALPLAALDPERTVYVASLSKIVGPGLRIGLIRAPRHVLHALGVGLRATTLMASPFGAEWASRLIAGPMDRIVGATRQEMRARQEILTARIPAQNLITRPEAFYAWLKLTNGWSADGFVRAADLKGVGVTPFSVFEVSSQPHTDAVRICLNGAPDRASLEEALEHLATLLVRGVSQAEYRSIAL